MGCRYATTLEIVLPSCEDVVGGWQAFGLVVGKEHENLQFGPPFFYQPLTRHPFKLIFFPPQDHVRSQEKQQLTEILANEPGGVARSSNLTSLSVYLFYSLDPLNAKLSLSLYLRG